MTYPKGAKTSLGGSGKRLLEIFHWTLTSRDEAISCEIQRASIPRLNLVQNRNLPKNMQV